MALVIMLMGVSGSGKTTFSHDLAEKVNIDLILSSDQIAWQNKEVNAKENRLKLIRQFNLEPISEHILMKNTKFLLSVLDRALEQDLDVILDRTNLDYESRAKFIRVAKKYECDVNLIFLEVDRKVAAQRIRERDSNYVTPEVLKWQFGDLDHPRMSEGFSDIITYDGQQLVTLT